MRARMVKVIAAVAVAALAVTGAARLHAQGEPGGPGGHGRWGAFGRGGGFGLALRGLDLTEEQRTQVRAIVGQHRDELRAAGQKLGAAFKAQRDAVSAVPVDEGLIRAKSAELAAAQTDAALLHAKVHSEVYQLLTPEQQAKAKELKAQRDARRAERQQRFQQKQK
jgi:protein CpxP